MCKETACTSRMKPKRAQPRVAKSLMDACAPEALSSRRVRASVAIGQSMKISASFEGNCPVRFASVRVCFSYFFRTTKKKALANSAKTLISLPNFGGGYMDRTCDPCRVKTGATCLRSILDLPDTPSKLRIFIKNQPLRIF